MNITNITLKYATGGNTTLKASKNITRLENELAAGTNEVTLTGAGPYYEVKVNNGTNDYTVNVPAFALGLGSTTLYTNGTNEVSTIAKQLLSKYHTANPTAFDLVRYQHDERTRLNNLITTEASSATPDKKRLKELKNDLKAIDKLNSKDVKDILSEEVDALESAIENGVEIDTTKAARTIENKIKTYLKSVENVEKIKVQLKNTTKSRIKVFSGIKKVVATPVKFVKNVVTAPINFVKDHKKGVVATVVAGAVAVGGYQLLKNHEDEKDNGSTTDTQTEVPAPVTSIESNAFESLYNANYRIYEDLAEELELSGYNYSDIITGYTFLEMYESLDLSKLHVKEVSSYIIKADALITKLCANGTYGNVSYEVIKSLRSGYEACVETFRNQSLTVLDRYTAAVNAAVYGVNGIQNGTMDSSELASFQAEVNNFLNALDQGKVLWMTDGEQMLAFAKTPEGKTVYLGAEPVQKENQKTLGTHPSMNA